MPKKIENVIKKKPRKTDFKSIYKSNINKQHVEYKVNG